MGYTISWLEGYWGLASLSREESNAHPIHWASLSIQPTTPLREHWKRGSERMQEPEAGEERCGMLSGGQDCQRRGLTADVSAAQILHNIKPTKFWIDGGGWSPDLTSCCVVLSLAIDSHRGRRKPFLTGNTATELTAMRTQAALTQLCVLWEGKGRGREVTRRELKNQVESREINLAMCLYGIFRRKKTKTRFLKVTWFYSTGTILCALVLGKLQLLLI